MVVRLDLDAAVVMVGLMVLKVVVVVRKAVAMVVSGDERIDVGKGG